MIKLSLKIQFFIAGILVAGSILLLFFHAISCLNNIETIALNGNKNNLISVLKNAHSELNIIGIFVLLTPFLAALYFALTFIKKFNKIKLQINKIANYDFSTENEHYKIADELSEIKTDLNIIQSTFGRFVKNTNFIIDEFFKLRYEKSIEAILEKTADFTKSLFNVKYVAISVFDENGKVKKFITRGVTEDIKNKIGRYPEGKGLLGYIHKTKETLMLDDISKHSHSVGFPANHPKMKTLLATPLISNDVSYGNLYISEKIDGSNFTEEDKKFIEMIAAIVVSNIIIYESMELANKRNNLLQEESEKLGGLINKLVEKDFTVDFNFELHEETNKIILDDLRVLVKSLTDVLKIIRDLTDNLASASNEISATTEELAATSSEQSNQIKEVALATDEMYSTIDSNAKNATKTAEKATQNEIFVKKSTAEIEKTIEKVKQIATFVSTAAQKLENLGKATNAITGILQVIDDIAEQTNLLALNAAIEAARAGEHGRGFAVVADEVRKLAERSSKSTKEISDIIINIQKETNSVIETMNIGNKEVMEIIDLAQNSQNSLKQILSNIGEVVQLVNQIAAANEQQSATSKQVNTNVENISNIIYESTQAISQIANAANDLARLANRLQDVLSTFKLNEYDKELKMLELRQN